MTTPAASTALREPAAVLAAADWREREAAHAERADALTAAHRERRARGEPHPIEDFLFTYYSYSPGLLRRWHPGAGVELADAAATPRAEWRWYAPGATSGGLVVDHGAMRRDKGAMLGVVERLLRRTAARPAQFGCFGLHEWAMVYRQGEHRHPVPLRLGQAATDEVVEAHDIRCTHFDAYRFFTPDAAPRNRFAPTRETQPDLEQPGCLHAGMDVYKWSVKLGPLAPGDVLLDAFELARDIRYLDMQASPYDMAAWGGEPVRIETPDGKAQYVRRQREFADRANALRARLLAALPGRDDPTRA
ncbi:MULTISPECIES: 3-methyladenine DNA glycosylase [unclassified Agromyces]|uniref:3-methyladenine DNA glycosylase n=1 Tax=unclassified Agromyces TaxID=2639701 RepID=UPI0030153665